MQGWKRYSIQEVAETQSGGTPNRSRSEYYNGTIPWLKTGELGSKYVYDTEEKISELAIKETSAKLIPENSVIVAMYGATIGKLSINKKEMASNQACCAIIPKKELYYEFLYYTLEFRKNDLIKMGSGAAQPNISQEIIRNYVIHVPEFKEQQKIADILSTWDKAIELKEKLIEQKKEQKKGLMQRLLTGEVRLPGFKGEWKEVRLGEVLKERKETGHVHLELLAITAQRGIVRRDEVDIKDNSSEDKSKYKRIMPLDIGYNTMRMWQGVSGVSKYEGIVSPAYTVLKPTDKVDSYFMGYLFKLPKVIDKFRRYSQGLVDDTLNLKYENFKVIKVRIPQDVNEQKAIAQILICVDKEIEFLEKELEALKQQKKGLMQLLLTGKIRVKC
jgi:type I restriction enzyme S subunit